MESFRKRGRTSREDRNSTFRTRRAHLPENAEKPYTILNETRPASSPESYDESPHAYRPLAENEIRLMQILPARPKDTIRIATRHVCLDEKPRYAFVSYVWGDASLEQWPIVCNGSSMSVLPRVARILESLRDNNAYGIEWYWMDFICINQSDRVEKREQVGLLPTICLRAQLTIGWTNVEMTETTANFLAQVATIAPAAYSRESCASILQGHTYVAAGDLERFESQYGALLVRLSARRSTGPSHIHRSLRYLFRTGSGSSPPVITGFDERRALVEIYHLLGSAYFSRWSCLIHED